ncbi:MAG: DsbA family oxidoreductase [Quisquiliibacterium sp.]
MNTSEQIDSSNPTVPFEVDVISDVVCPWCYIGKKHLDDALAAWGERGNQAPVVRWHPFQLNPTMPPEGMDRGDYLQAKFGNPQGGPGYQRVIAAARSAQLAFEPQRITRQPNTLHAHALIAAGEQGGSTQVVDALFKAYFVDGVDLCSQEALRSIASSCGLAEDEINAAFSAESVQAVASRDAQARNAGIGGVPFFVIAQQIGVSGAQGTEALLDAFERAQAQRT